MGYESPRGGVALNWGLGRLWQLSGRPLNLMDGNGSAVARLSESTD